MCNNGTSETVAGFLYMYTIIARGKGLIIRNKNTLTRVVYKSCHNSGKQKPSHTISQ